MTHWLPVAQLLHSGQVGVGGRLVIERNDTGHHALLVNGNYLGTGAAAEAHVDVDLSGLAAETVVCDLNPETAESAFLRLAAARGHRTLDGLGMLARQGAAGFKAWTGVDAPLEVMIKVCDTLAYAHAKNVIHRDLKPANVMVGRYGEVSVDRFDGSRLPYADNLVNLLVVSAPASVDRKEILRVLAPGGAAITVGADNGPGTADKLVKPWPAEIDEWTHYLHGPDNNAVAQDSVVGPPRRYQWLGEPEWQRSHLAMPSINSMVSTKGRLFTVEDLGSAEHPALPGKQALVARDAYNGVVLWQVMFSDWHPTYIRNKEMPVQIQRRLVAVGDRVYVTLGYAAPVSVLDAATGEVLSVIEDQKASTVDD